MKAFAGGVLGALATALMVALLGALAPEERPPAREPAPGRTEWVARRSAPRDVAAPESAAPSTERFVAAPPTPPRRESQDVVAAPRRRAAADVVEPPAPSLWTQDLPEPLFRATPGTTEVAAAEAVSELPSTPKEASTSGATAATPRTTPSAGETPPPTPDGAVGRGDGRPRRAAARTAPEPRYPRGAREAGEEGVVVVRIRVDVAGRVASAEVASSTATPRLDAAALEAVRAWRFEPATRDGRPTEDVVTRRFVFRLEDAP